MSSPAPSQDVWLEAADGSVTPMRGNCSFGRSSENTVIIRETRASRRHAIIHAQEDGEFWLVDLGSINGTLLNDRRVSRPVRLQNGDRVTIADAVFVFHQSAGTAGMGDPSSIGLATVAEIRTAPCWLVIADLENFTPMSQQLPADELAAVVGRWVHGCKEHIEARGGAINKYLGDGFMAYWREREGAAAKIADALIGLKGVRAAAEVEFRVVVHHGNVSFGGVTAHGEESMMGPELNFAFRMEKVAGSLAVPFLLSAPAAMLLTPHLPLQPIAGEHELKGFKGQHRFFAWT